MKGLMQCARVVVLLVPLFVAGCATTAAAPSEQLEIVTFAEKIFAAMAAGDAKALETMVHPQARLVALRNGSERELTRDKWIGGIAASQEPVVERMWNPRVERSGDLASLWAPYDLHVGKKFSHCGVNAMHFSRTQGSWLLRSVTFTVETECGGRLKSEE